MNQLAEQIQNSITTQLRKVLVEKFVKTKTTVSKESANEVLKTIRGELFPTWEVVGVELNGKMMEVKFNVVPGMLIEIDE